MKLLSQNYKAGIVKLKITDRDDLWYLSHIIDPSDKLTGITTRKIKIGDGDNAKITRKTYRITIEAKTLDLQLDSDTLRVNGTNTTEHDDIPKGSFQNISITIDDEITIHKQYKQYQIDKLKEAASDKSPFLLALFDREEALIAKTTKFGYQVLTELKGSSEKKHEKHQATGNFYLDLYKTLLQYQKRSNPQKIILATPAFYKEDFLKAIPKDPNFKKLIIQATVSSVTESAINELLKDTKLKQVISQSRASQEINLMQELLSEIGKDGAYAYSKDEVQNAANQGAIKKLLITTKLITKAKEDSSYEELDKLLTLIDKSKGEIHILNSDEESGRRLDGLSGIAAILRYKLI